MGSCGFPEFFPISFLCVCVFPSFSYVFYWIPMVPCVFPWCSYVLSMAAMLRHAFRVFFLCSCCGFLWLPYVLPMIFLCSSRGFPMFVHCLSYICHVCVPMFPQCFAIVFPTCLLYVSLRVPVVFPYCSFGYPMLSL